VQVNNDDIFANKGKYRSINRDRYIIDDITSQKSQYYKVKEAYNIKEMFRKQQRSMLQKKNLKVNWGRRSLGGSGFIILSSCGRDGLVGMGSKASSSGSSRLTMVGGSLS
jgi:hypothetical protein